MKVGVISDTHLHWDSEKTRGLRGVAEKLVYGSKKAKESLFTAAVEKHFQGVDLIVHAGDLVEPGVVDYLSELAPVQAVRGNMDLFDESLAELLPEKILLTLEGHRVVVIHGWGAPKGILQRLADRVIEDRPDLVIFGHTHRATDEIFQGVRYFNPGSPTDKFFAPYISLGLLEIGQEITARIIRL
jgi:uncharacterized protein